MVLRKLGDLLNVSGLVHHCRRSAHSSEDSIFRIFEAVAVNRGLRVIGTSKDNT